MNIRTGALGAISAVLAALTAHSAAQATLTFATIDPPGSTYTSPTEANGGRVVGWYSATYVYGKGGPSDIQGFLWNGSAYTTIDFPGSPGTNPVGVSGNYVVGTYGNGKTSFLWNGSSYSAIGFPGAENYTQACAVSSGGTVVGSYNGVYNGVSGTYGFAYSGSTYTTLLPAGAATSAASLIGGSIVFGEYQASAGAPELPFIWDGVNYTTPDVPGSTGTGVRAVNGDEYCGAYAAGGTGHGYLWNGSGYVTVDPPGAASSQCLGFVAAGVLGEYADATGKSHYFVWDGTNYDTFDLPVGYSLAYPSSADGNVIIGDYYDSEGLWHGFEATVTIPEPGTLALLAVGGVGVLRRRRAPI